VSEASPFSPDRFEYEHRHTYFLRGEKFDLLEQFKPTFLVGSRGSGKTTLLMAVNWFERINNPYLNEQFKSDVFAKKYVGVYAKIPRFQLPMLRKWCDPNSLDYHHIFSQYIDLIVVQLLAEGVAELLANGTATCPPKVEHEVMSAFVDVIGPVKTRARREPTVLAFARLMEARRRLIEAAPRAGRKPADLAAQLADDVQLVSAPDVAQRLAKIMDYGIPKTEIGWHFKACIDEAETLTNSEQQAINTAVRTAAWPLSYILAYVRVPATLVETHHHDLSLGRADVTVVHLDDMSDKEFAELATGVATVRVQAALRNKSSKSHRPLKPVDLLKTLGKSTVNSLLELALNTSVSQETISLIARAKDLADHPFFSKKTQSIGDDEPPEAVDEERTERQRPILPIFQAYLLDQLGVRIPDPTSPASRRRAQESADIRKRHVAAYLGVCRDCGVDVRYGGGNIVLQLSDRCIRDFLDFMHQIFKRTGWTVTHMIENRVDLLLQDAAIKLASKEKQEFLPKSGIVSPREVENMVDSLGRLTRKLQAGPARRWSLVNSESGLFTFDPEEGDPAKRAMALVREASDAAYLRLRVRTADGGFAFRLHASLAPLYSTSYRGAYYAVRLTAREIVKFADESNPDVREAAVDGAFRRIIGEDLTTMPLFDGDRA